MKDTTSTTATPGISCLPREFATGFPSFDQAIPPFGSGGVYLIAARTGGGATSFACNIVLANARAGVPVLYLCGRGHQEMHIWCRLYSIAHDTSTSTLLNGTCSPDHLRTLCQSSHLIGHLSLQTYQLDRDEPLACALAAIARHSATGPAGLVVIDTLQGLTCSSLFGVAEQIGPYSALRRLAWLVETTGTTVIATSRLCCRADRATSPGYNAADLAGSSRLSNLARSTLTLHRTNLSGSTRPDPDDTAIGIEILPWRGRQRCGPPVRTLFETDNGRFHDLGPASGPEE